MPQEDWFQPMLGIAGDYAVGTATTPAVIQAESDWLDTKDIRYLVVEAEVLKASAVTIKIETAMRKEGPWTSFSTIASGYCFQTYGVSKEAGATNRLRSYVRWRLEGGAAWEACFRINVTESGREAAQKSVGTSSSKRSFAGSRGVFSSTFAQGGPRQPSANEPLLPANVNLPISPVVVLDDSD